MSEEISNLVVRIGLDGANFNQGIQSLNRQMRVVRSEFQAASTGMSNFNNSTQGLRTRANSLSRQLRIQQGIVNTLNRSYQESVQRHGEDARQTQNLASRLNRAIASYNRLEGSLNATNQQIADQTNRWRGLQRSFNSVSQRLDSLGSKLKNTGRLLTATVTAPILGIATASAKMAMEFSDGVAKIGTIADTSKEPISQLRKELLSLSNQTGVSVKDLSEAEYQAISAGVDTANSTKFLSTAVKAAKGGFATTTDAIDGLTSVLNSYGLKASEVTKISDQMLEAQNYGKTTFKEMSQYIGQVVPTTASLKISTDELFGSIATLTKNGIQTRESITGIRAALSNILKPTKDAQKEAKKLGLNFSAAHLKAVGWSKFLQEIKDKTHGNTQAMSKLFGSVDALNSMLVLTGKGSKDFANVLGKMKHSAGATEDAFNKMQNTTGEKLRRSFNKLKNAGIQLGDSLTPAINSISNVISKLANAFSKLTPHQRNMVIAFGAVAASIGPLLLIGGSLISSIGTIMGAFSALSGVIASAGGVLAVLTGPIGIVIVSLVALGVAGYELVKHWDVVKKDTKKVFNAIGNFSKKLKNDAINEFHNLTSKGKKLFTNFSNDGKSIIKGFANGAVDSFKWLYNHNYYFKDLVDGAKKNWEKAENDAKRIWGRTKSGLSNIWKSTTAKAHSTFSPLNGWFSDQWNQIGSGVSSGWSHINNKLSTEARSAIHSIDHYFSGLWDKGYSWGKNMLSGFIDGIKHMIGSLRKEASKVTGEVAKFLGFHSPAKEGEGRYITVWGENMIGGFIDGVNNAIPRLKSTMDKVIVPPTFGVHNLAYANSNNPSQSNSNKTMPINIHFNGDNHFTSEQDIQTFADKIGSSVRSELFSKGVKG